METKPRCANCARYDAKKNKCGLHRESVKTQSDWVCGQWKQKEKKDADRTDSE